MFTLPRFWSNTSEKVFAVRDGETISVSCFSISCRRLHYLSYLTPLILCYSIIRNFHIER